MLPTVIVELELKVPVAILSATTVTISPLVTCPILTGFPEAETAAEVSVPLVVAIFT